MNENPFSEADDNDRTILRVKGGATPAPSPAPLHSRPVQAAPAARLEGEADALPKVGRSPMTAAAAPLLDLLARIGTGTQAVSAQSAEDLRNGAVRALQAFEAECRAADVSHEQLRAAHYALCAALDDTALATSWGQASSWASNTLSSAFHQDVRTGERFFDLLAGMQQEPGRYLPALEICYYCLALGLRGRYRRDSRGGAEIDRIREGLFQLLARLNGPWERELSPHWRGVDAPHRGPPTSVPVWVFGAVAASLLALGYVAAALWINAKGDEFQQRLVRLPPAKPPLIERAAAPEAPVPIAAAQASDAVKRFRKLLQPEIDDRVVVVEGDAQRLTIRILARGMFESGDADVRPSFVALLKRIGEALRAEPGRVAVLGHSDNRPIRTVRFPSNSQLSAARAESAKAILVGAAGQGERFSSVGRADTEPLASNDTVEGREQNRRIDIVLTPGEAR